MPVDREGTFTVVRNDSETVKCELRDALGSPVNISGATIVFRLALGSAVIVEKTSANASEIEITDAATGQFTLKLAQADTDREEETYEYEYEITLSDGKVITPFQGDFVIVTQLG